MKRITKIKTERTFMRELSIDDATDFFALNQDPSVLQYTGDVPFTSVQAAAAFLKTYDQYTKYGVGRFAVVDRYSNEFMGWCGLKYSIERAEYDIGFRFHKKHWNKGLATETAKACINDGFVRLGIQRIVGRAMAENTASIKVLQKLGMEFKSTFSFGGYDGVIYEILAPKQ